MTDGDVIKALGGPAKLGRLLGVTRTRPYSWAARGIPAGFRWQIFLLCVARGVALDPSAFLPAPPPPKAGRRQAETAVEDAHEVVEGKAA